MQLEPFLPWVGGKKKLLKTIDSHIPFKKTDSFTYIEPFLGGGSVLFHMLNNFPNINKIIVNDLNSDVIRCYCVIRDNVETLIEKLITLETLFNSYPYGSVDRRNIFNSWKVEFNSKEYREIERTALLLSLIKTCFNANYRVNKKGELNTSLHSLRKRLHAYNYENLKSISSALKNITILNTDFSNLNNFIDNNTFCYLDPPYIPLTKTSNFTKYTPQGFNYDDHIRLKLFCDNMTVKEAKWLQSNSSADETIKLYTEYSIRTISVYRSIAGNAKHRGNVNELLISNY